MRTLIFSVLLCLFSIILMAENLAPNPSFEETNPKDGKICNYLGGKKSTERPRTGNFCLKQDADPENKWNVVQSAPPYIKCESGQWYRLSVWNRNTMPAGDLKFGIRFINAKGKTISYKFCDTMKNSLEWSYCSFDFLPPKKTVSMAIYFLVDSRVPSGEAWWEDVKIEKIEAPSLLTVKPLESAVFFKNAQNVFIPNYLYSRKKSSWVGIMPQGQKLHIMASDFKQYPGRKLKFTLKQRYGSKIFRSQTVPIDRAHMEIPLELEQLPLGTYAVNIAVFNADGNILKTISKTVYIVSLPEPIRLEPIKQVTWGRWYVKVNETPFVAVSMSHDMDLDRDSEFHRRLAMLGDNVHTLFVDSTFGKNSSDEIVQANIQEMKKQLDITFESNAYAQLVLSCHAWGFDTQTKKYQVDNIVKVVNALKNHPGLFAWSLCDEPDARKIPVAEIKRVYKAVKAIDPKHPIVTNLCLEKDFDTYAGTSDFASYDRYPYPWHSLSLIHSLNNKIIKSSGGNKPLRSYLQAYSSPQTAQLPPPEWLRAEIYLCITQGATIFPYYCFHGLGKSFGMSDNGELQSSIQKFNMELQYLRNVINVPPVNMKIEGLEGNVSYILKCVANRYYLFAVNTDNYRKDLTFSLPFYTAGQVEALFEDARKIKVNAKGTLNETFMPYEVHIYKY